MSNRYKNVKQMNTCKYYSSAVYSLFKIDSVSSLLCIIYIYNDQGTIYIIKADQIQDYRKGKGLSKAVTIVFRVLYTCSTHYKCFKDVMKISAYRCISF